VSGASGGFGGGAGVGGDIAGTASAGGDIGSGVGGATGVGGDIAGTASPGGDIGGGVGGATGAGGDIAGTASAGNIGGGGVGGDIAGTASAGNLGGGVGGAPGVGGDIAGTASAGNLGGDIAGTASVDGDIGGGIGASGDVGSGVDTMQSAAVGGGVAGSAGGGVSSNLDVSQGSKVTRDATGTVGDAQMQTFGTNAEAGFYNEVGHEGQVAVQGGGVGMGEGHVDSAMYEHDVERQGKHAAHVEGLEQRDAMSASGEAAVEVSGYKNPSGELERANNLEADQRDRTLGRIDHASDVSGEAQATIADPTGAATGAATEVGMREAQERAPVSPSGVRGEVHAATDVVRDPAAAGGAEVEVAVDAEVRGVDPNPKK
jgi:hypothetical protein